MKRKFAVGYVDFRAFVFYMYSQSLVKHQPKNHKVDNFHVLTKELKFPSTREKLKQEQLKCKSVFLTKGFL